ncbi:MAG: hypothetical protein PWP23_2763 [Candidatus Sumerlaeota bacterium]|nr:hypothetical protein [Candidatus Sumerlaeota bacterium]
MPSCPARRRSVPLWKSVDPTSSRGVRSALAGTLTMSIRTSSLALLLLAGLLVPGATLRAQEQPQNAEAPAPGGRPPSDQPSGGRPDAAQQPAEKPAEPASGTPSTPRAPSQPAPGSSGAAAPDRRQSTATTGEFQLRASGDAMMLRLTPEGAPDMQNIDVIEGNEFTTDLLLDNPGNDPVDHLRVVLDFNPNYVTPVAINDSALKASVQGLPTATVDRVRGQIVYEAQLDPPIYELPGPILFVRWQATKPVFFSSIGFGRLYKGDYSEVFFEGDPLLGQSHDPGDGTVSMNVTIIPADPAEALIMKEDPQLYLGSDERVGGVTVTIEPPRQPVHVGDVFTLDLVLDNRAHSQIDGISLLIQYDPSVIEIIDADLDNWITLGTNILDGKFRNQFSFDYHMANSVYPVRGQIEYRVGTSTPADLVGAYGTFAQIHARAIAPTAGTALKFLFSPRPGSRTTEGIYMGQDVFGDTRIKNDGVRGAFFQILP